MKINIVGAGLSGVTAAIVLRSQGHDVEIFETREHIAGNCFDGPINNIMVHQYGPHAFHTNDERVWKFLNRYTTFNSFELRVRGRTPNKDIIPIPFNDVSASIIGEKTEEEIINLLFKDYTKKQWGISYNDMPRSITNRTNLRKIRRLGSDSRYSLDKYQGIPSEGYTSMFSNMLEGIKIHLGVMPDAWKKYPADKVVFTGKIDEFFKFSEGHLPYRSLRFEYFMSSKKEHVQLNECNSHVPYSRSIDHSHWHRQNLGYTIVSREYPCDHTDSNLPFYPKPFGEGQDIYSKYKKIARSHHNILFLGRLATYKYLDMWMAIAQVFSKLNYEV